MKTVVVGTAGHIDHGKSALIRSLTGIDPDRLKEEQARGITIDLGFAHLTIGDVQIAFVDVPGHERFVRNMLAGAGGIDAVLLVVAANESVMPQTREHFDICRLLGLDRGLVALTKSDTADADTADLAAADVRELVKRSFLDGAPIIPVSVRTGHGLEALRSALAGLAGPRPRQHRPGVVRLPVDRAFTIKGFGVVVTGTLVSGTLAVGDALAVLPAGHPARVRGLQVHGRAVSEVSAPQRVAVNLAGVDAASLRRGVTLATPGALAATSRADVHLELLRGARPLAHGARVRIHHGTTEIFARMLLAATRPASGDAWQPAHPGDARVEIAPGGEAYARLRFEEPAVLTRGDRLIVRAASPVVTIGGARVLDPAPGAGGVRRSAALARFVRIDADSERFVDVLLAEAASRGLDAGALIQRAGLDARQAAAELERRVADSLAVVSGARAFATAAVEALRGQVLAELTEFHRTHPEEAGIPRETLRSRAAARAGDLFDAVLGRLVAAGTVKDGERIALATHQAQRSAADGRTREIVQARFRAAGLAPPDPGGVAAELGLPDVDVQRTIRALVQEGQLVRVGDLIFHRDSLDVLKAAVAGLRAGQPAGARVTLDVSAFKARHGLSRKFAIPLLEWLDRERVTRRVGDARVVL